MAVIDILDILRLKQGTPMEFRWDALTIPPMYYYLTPQDIEQLKQIATSVRLSSKIEEKYKMIDNIMRYRGFKRFSAGTNRVIYKFLEDDRFVVKIAVDKVGMQDNPKEFQNQFLLKPYVTKMFYISPCGTVGFAERVLPIKNKEEFRRIAEDVFELLVNKILGRYVVDDIGTKYFMNWGVRMKQGPVLLDYPYVYRLDGNKLFCNKQDIVTGLYCDGEIDYDVGFNHLVCQKCGKIYLARDLRDDSSDNKIIIKGGTTMKVTIKNGNETVYSSIGSEEFMKKPKKENKSLNNGFKFSIRINGGDYNTPVINAGDKIQNGEEINNNLQKVPPLNVEIKTIESSEEVESENKVNDTVETFIESENDQINESDDSAIEDNSVEDSYYGGPLDEDDEEPEDENEANYNNESTNEESSTDDNQNHSKIVVNNRRHGGPRLGSTFIPKR